MKNSLIPPHLEGKQNDLSHSVICSDLQSAQACYKRACQRLFSLARWHELAGMLSADMMLTDANGNALDRLAKKGDYVRINIPGPGSQAGEGYDWVEVELALCHQPGSDNEEYCALRVRPCANPAKGGRDTAHFFTASSTSTFIVERKDKKVTASYHGRNEQPNTHTTGAIDNVRNAVITSGALAGLSEAQWNALIRGFLE